MKNNKRTKVDVTLTEQLKHGPGIIHLEIGGTFDTLARAGKYLH